MKTIEIKGEVRTGLGKKATSELRKEGKVPCIIYGGKENVNFIADEAELKPLLYTPNVYLVKLSISGKNYLAILKDLQFDPVSDKVTHIDFFETSEDKQVVMNIPVRIVGNSVGVKKGGKLRLAKRHLKIKALPKFLPDVVEVNIETLDVGQVIKVGDLKYEGLTIVNNDREPVVSVLSSRLTAKAGEGEAAA